jgi:hypothetical protein
MLRSSTEGKGDDRQKKKKKVKKSPQKKCSLFIKP